MIESNASLQIRSKQGRFIMVLAKDLKKVAIWGAGLEGRAAQDFFAQRFPEAARVFIVDKIPNPIKMDVEFILEADLARYSGAFPIDLIVKSPGVSLYKPAVLACKAQGIPFTSGTNIWLENYPDAKTVAITGTKGKSTVSALIDFILRQLGVSSRLLGNMGIPLIASEPGGDVTVLELSSYQTADLNTGPDIAVLTNLFEEHLNWHGSVAQYHADKLRLFTDNKTQHVICPQAYAKLFVNVSREKMTAVDFENYNLDRERNLYFQSKKIGSKFPLKGQHNLENFALAHQTVRQFSDEFSLDISIDFSDFLQLPHRLQEIMLPQNVLFVDDSISTVPEAAISAMHVYRENVHLFIGGFDRGIGYEALLAALPVAALKTLTLFGPVGERLLPELSGQKYPVIYSASLGVAVSEMADNISPGDTVLLSPAAPSYDEFKNFEARAEFFKSRLEQEIFERL